jgi:hypothetical protein
MERLSAGDIKRGKGETAKREKGIKTAIFFAGFSFSPFTLFPFFPHSLVPKLSLGTRI